MLHNFRHYWERILAWVKPYRLDGQPAAVPDDLEREISAISAESHSLADQVSRVRSDYEHAMEDDQRKLTDLGSRLAELESERVETRERVETLENALAEATGRVEQSAQQIRVLQSNTEEQAKQFQASLSEANDRLFETDNQIKVLATRLDIEHREILETFAILQDRLRKQDVRMTWTIAAAVFAVLLGALIGAVLVWDVQKNTVLLAGMSRDIRELVTAVTQSGMQHTPAAEQTSLAPPGAAPATARGTGTNQPAGTGKEPTPITLGSILNDARTSSRLGIKQPTRADARRFFENNAGVEGMLSLPSGVQYRVLRPGTGESPSLADQVTVAYVGIKPDGAVFDETYSSGAPVTFSMGEVIPGWQEVLLHMQEGAEFELYVPPNLSTKGGTRKRSMLGYEPSIYLIELLAVVKNDPTGSSVPVK